MPKFSRTIASIATCVVAVLTVVPQVHCQQVIRYGTPIVGPIVPAPVYQQAAPASTTQHIFSVSQLPTSPFDACQCGPGHSGDCDCRSLNCQIRLMSKCYHSKPLAKEPIPCRVVGRIPKFSSDVSCYKKIEDFVCPTRVPQIHCNTETCFEIGKKRLECLKDCWFEVCVPVIKCKKETVECKLVQKPMNMELWERKDRGRIVYDVYVVNESDEASPFHAGGMPEKWVVLHCATLAQLRARFPGKTSLTANSTGGESSTVVAKKTSADRDLVLKFESEDTGRSKKATKPLKATLQSDSSKIAAATSATK